MVVLDATTLMLLLHPNARIPNGRAGRPVEHAAARVTHLIADLDARRVAVVIPAPAPAEVLVRVGVGASEEFIERIGRHWSLRVEPFDTRAAIEVAAMTRDALDGGYAKGDSNATWAKLKYDRQIVAVAKVHRATAIYSDDGDVRRIASRVNIDVIGLEELPIPPKKPDPEKTGGGRPQIDFLDGELP